MPCFFCDIFNHSSQNCNVYVCDESRRNQAKSKNCCYICLTTLNENNVSSWCCKNCNSKRKCFICFSRYHHTVYCADRLNVRQFFVPNIDNDLFSRFIKILDLEEYYSMAFLSPKMFNFFNQKPLSVIECSSKYQKNINSNFVITESFYHNFKTSLPSLKTIIFKCEEIHLEQTRISAEEFYYLLSPKVIYLNCTGIEFTSTTTFSSTLKKAQNVEILYFDETNIEVGNSWPNDILKWNKGIGLRRLKLPIQDTNFDVDSFVRAIKLKSKNDINIIIDLFNNEEDNSYEISNNITNAMLPYFNSTICHRYKPVSTRHGHYAVHISKTSSFFIPEHSFFPSYYKHKFRKF